MLSPIYHPHEYQRVAANFVFDRLYDGGGAGLLLDPGLGKTAITLDAVTQLRTVADVNRVLVIAPLWVVHTVWPAEIRKWRFPLTPVILHGPPKTRRRRMHSRADVHLINPEGVPWLVSQPDIPDYDVVVIDESTKFKNWTAKRTKSLRKLVPTIERRLILTGTPAPNNLGDLFAQIYMIDLGESLGSTVTFFRSNYMQSAGYLGRGWEFQKHKADRLEKQIAPLVLRQSALDHLDLPDYLEHSVWVDLPPAARRQYDDLERKLFLELEEGKDLTASSAGAAYGMCRQLANGGLYETPDIGDRMTHHIHDAKLEALVDIVEGLGGKSVMVAYQFNHDLERIQKAFPDCEVIAGGRGGATKSQGIVDRWNDRKIHVLAVQCQALSHGANMQKGGNDIVWFGLTDQLEIFLQLNRRIYRQGVEGQVRIHKILAKDTVDKAVADRIELKDSRQTALLESLKKYRKERR